VIESVILAIVCCQYFKLFAFTTYKMAVGLSLYENPDLKRERLSCHFDKDEITYLIDGGVDKTKYRRELGKQFMSFHILFACLVLKKSMLYSTSF